MNTHDIELPPLPPADKYIEVDSHKMKASMDIPYWREKSLKAYARSAVEPYQAEIARLKRIINSRPAINAGLPQTYIDWSHSIYLMEAARVLEDMQ